MRLNRTIERISAEDTQFKRKSATRYLYQSVDLRWKSGAISSHSLRFWYSYQIFSFSILNVLARYLRAIVGELECTRKITERRRKSTARYQGKEFIVISVPLFTKTRYDRRKSRIRNTNFCQKLVFSGLVTMEVQIRGFVRILIIFSVISLLFL